MLTHEETVASLQRQAQAFADWGNAANATLNRIRALCVSRSGDLIEADPIWPDEIFAILDGRPSV